MELPSRQPWLTHKQTPHVTDAVQLQTGHGMKVSEHILSIRRGCHNLSRTVLTRYTKLPNTNRRHTLTHRAYVCWESQSAVSSPSVGTLPLPPSNPMPCQPPCSLSSPPHRARPSLPQSQLPLLPSPSLSCEASPALPAHPPMASHCPAPGWSMCGPSTRAQCHQGEPYLWANMRTR